MTVSYQRRDIRGFPSLPLNEPLQTDCQLALPGSDDTVHSTVTRVGRSDHPAFERYYVEHETLRSMHVRFENATRDRIIQIVQLHLYQPQDGGILYADAKGTYVNELLGRLSKAFPGLRASGRQVDLVRLRQEALPEIRGAWFRNLKIADVRAAAVYGPTVSESEDWKRYERNGEIAALNVEFIYLSAPHSVLITHNGTIVLHGDLTEHDSLQLLQEIDLIVSCFATLTKSLEDKPLPT